MTFYLMGRLSGKQAAPKGRSWALSGLYGFTDDAWSWFVLADARRAMSRAYRSASFHCWLVDGDAALFLSELRYRLDLALDAEWQRGMVVNGFAQALRLDRDLLGDVPASWPVARPRKAKTQRKPCAGFSVLNPNSGGSNHGIRQF